MNDCIFCKIISKDIPSHTIYEDDVSIVFLDINPVNPGHALVVPKEHHTDLSSTPEDIAQHLMSVVRRVAPSVATAVGAKGYNLGVNNGADAGQVIFHTHLHIMPRFPNDGHTLWSGKPAKGEEIARTAEAIRKEMN